jgi:cell division protein FtsW
MGLLMLIGLVVMYAIGPQRANVLNNAQGANFSDTYFVVKQVISLVLAIVAFVIVSKVPFRWFQKNAEKILIIGLALCVLLVLFGNILDLKSIAQCSLGACRWFELGPLGSFQPAEFLKFGVLVYLATFLSVRIRQGLLNDVQKTIIPVIGVTLVALFFVVILQKDMGTGLALASIVASILMVSGVSRKIGAQLLIGAVILGIISVVIAPHRIERILTFVQGDNQSATADDTGYHIRNAMIALGTGGLFGRGIGNSIQATGYLPEAINDSVFAIMGETFGFIGVTVILGLFTALLMRLLRITDHMPDMAMKLAVAGIFGWLVAHVVLNVASMVGVFPLTGITLPLLSFGGTSMIFITGALGLAFQLSRYTSHDTIVENREDASENTRSRRGIGRSRYAGRRRNSGA